VVASTALDREAVDEAVGRGSDLLKQGRFDEAQRAFRTALLLDENNPRILALLGLTCFRAGQFTQAQPIYEELVERAPTDASHRLNLGLVYLKLGESEKAIGALESSRALDPSQGRAVSYLGLAYARAGRYAEAYRSFLLAGQNELASEIEVNLTAAEREGIHAQLARGGVEMRKTPPPPPKSSAEIPLMSMPAIVIDRPHAEATGARLTEGSGSFDINMEQSGVFSPPLDAEDAFAQVRAIPGSPAAAGVPKPHIPASTDSQQFVLPERQAVPRPVDGQSMISTAVEAARPSASATTAAIPLSQLATDALVRPEDSSEMFEVTSTGALVIRVVERTVTRLDGIHITGGELEFEPATRRSRGSQTDEKFDFGGSRMHSVAGKGYLIAVPDEKTKFIAVTLDDDIFYLREDLVFAFDATLRWENGNVPGLRGKLPIVQFRGDGGVALRTGGPLVRVKLAAQSVVYVDATRLAGWIGRVIPRAVVPPKHGPMGEICIECTGEGVVLVDPSGSLPAAHTSTDVVKHAPPRPPPSQSMPPKSDAASGPIELDIVNNADWLTDAEEGAAEKATADDAGRDEI
jgi:hypothetical protein